MASFESVARFAGLAAFGLLTTLCHAGDLLFQDVTVAAGVDVWHDTSGYSHANYTAGGAVADFNNDGWIDLFAISGGDGNVPDRLFINNGDGTFTDEAAAWGLGTPHHGKGAAVADFNGDGWTDLFVTSAGPVGNAGPGHHKLFRNNGNGTFTDIAASAGVNFTTVTLEDGFGASFGDIDLDGDLDLIVAGFASGNAGTRLFVNNGDETFTDVTVSIGLMVGVDQTYAFTPRLVDMDGDWYPELLLVADFGTSRYFRNNTNGTFLEMHLAANAGQEENGMGGNVGDWNGDGRLDWYVTSIYQPAINWTGNKLYHNIASHFFTEHAAAMGCDDGGYGWGALSVDFDHDGHLDIAEVNGGSSNGGTFGNEPAYLWIRNSNTGVFDEMGQAVGFDHTGRGRGVVNFDYDNDGDQDIVVFSYLERLSLFENMLGGSGTHWLRVFLETGNSPGLAPDGYGAVVTATIGETSIMRVMTSGDNFLSHSELSAHFGLGDATIVDELRVDWPDGTSTVMMDVAVDQTLTIDSNPVSVPGDLDDDGLVTVSDLLILLGAWGDCPRPCPPCDADLNDDCTVSVTDLLVLLGNWS